MLRLLVGLVSLLVLAGCGEERRAEQRVAGTPDPGHAEEVDRNPYALTCGDIARQSERTENQKLVIRAEFALAREPALRKRVRAMTENRVGRSVYWAMTDLCKGQAESFTPGEQAVEAVRRGKVLVQPPARGLEPSPTRRSRRPSSLTASAPSPTAAAKATSANTQLGAPSCG